MVSFFSDSHSALPTIRTATYKGMFNYVAISMICFEIITEAIKL